MRDVEVTKYWITDIAELAGRVRYVGRTARSVARFHGRRIYRAAAVSPDRKTFSACGRGLRHSSGHVGAARRAVTPPRRRVRRELGIELRHRRLAIVGS